MSIEQMFPAIVLLGLLGIAVVSDLRRHRDTQQPHQQNSHNQLLSGHHRLSLLDDYFY